MQTSTVNAQENSPLHLSIVGVITNRWWQRTATIPVHFGPWQQNSPVNKESVKLLQRSHSHLQKNDEIHRIQFVFKNVWFIDFFSIGIVIVVVIIVFKLAATCEKILVFGAATLHRIIVDNNQHSHHHRRRLPNPPEKNYGWFSRKALSVSPHRHLR